MVRQVLREIAAHFRQRNAAFFVAILCGVIVGIIVHARGALPIALLSPTGIFVAIMALLFAVMRPQWAWLAFVAALPLEAVPLLTVEGSDVRPYQLLGTALFLALIVRRDTWRLPAMRSADIGVALFACGTLITTILRDVPLREALIIGSFVAWYALGRVFLQSWRDIRRTAVFALGTAVIIAAWSIVQGAITETVMDARVQGTFAEPNWLGMYAAVIVVMALGMRRWGVVISSVAAIMLILTVTRSAYLAAACGVIVAAALYGAAAQWQAARRFLARALTAGAVAVAVVWIGQLTRFDLIDRVASVATARQTITVACATADGAARLTTKGHIAGMAALADYRCVHIRLEEEAAWRARGAQIVTVTRPDPSIGVRAQIYARVYALWQRDWFTRFFGVGWGRADFGRDANGTPLNSSNALFAVWLGGGMVALIGVLWYAGAVIYGVWRHRASRRAALFGSVLATLACANLFNAGVLLGFVWITLAGCALASRRLVRR